MNVRLHLLAFSAAVLAADAMAFNLGFLKETPISKFNKQDVELLIGTANKALDESADGVTTEWSNPETGSSGSIKPLDSHELNGRKCRTTVFTNAHKSLHGGGTSVLCRQKDGAWKVVK